MKRRLIIIATALTVIVTAPGLVLAYLALFGYEPTELQGNAVAALLTVGALPCIAAWIVAGEAKS